jgi:hypothetical protein
LWAARVNFHQLVGGGQKISHFSKSPMASPAFGIHAKIHSFLVALPFAPIFGPQHIHTPNMKILCLPILVLAYYYQFGFPGSNKKFKLN